MNEIFERTTIRQYTPEPISDEDAEKLMRAAMAAPSAGNQQPWEFVLTRDAEKLQALSETSKFAGPIGRAALGIIVCRKTAEMRFPQYADQDLSAACENILLEATSLGLGAAWLGIYPEQDRIEAVAEAVGLSHRLEAFALIAVGHPESAQEPRGPKNYDPERVHWL